jgi:hypothetical protein
MIRHQAFLKPGRPMHLIGDKQYTFRHCERAQIESIVVQDAQRQAIALRLRPARLMPADRGGVQGDWIIRIISVSAF